MVKLERINGENAVAEFPDIYNKNNSDVENEFGDIQKKLIEIAKKLKSKVDRSEIESTIERVAKGILKDDDYLTREDIKDILDNYNKDYDLSGVIDTLEKLTKRIDEIEESLNKRISKIEKQLEDIDTSIPSNIDERLSALENVQYYPEITEVDGGHQYIIKKYK